MKKHFTHQTTAAMLIAVTSVSTLGLAITAQSAKAAPPPGIVEIPRDVLIFPANISTGSGDATPAAQQTASQKMAQEIVTNAFREYFAKSNLGVAIYSRRLPSIQRAVNEGLKAEDAAAGPGDDETRALRFAQIVGAAEYITLDVTNYKYDAATRTAAFNVNVFRKSVDDNGAALAPTVAKPASGVAPADVALSRQEGSALARAAAQVAEETFQDLYPQVASLNAANMAKMNTKGKKK